MDSQTPSHTHTRRSEFELRWTDSTYNLVPMSSSTPQQSSASEERSTNRPHQPRGADFNSNPPFFPQTPTLIPRDLNPTTHMLEDTAYRHHVPVKRQRHQNVSPPSLPLDLSPIEQPAPLYQPTQRCSPLSPILMSHTNETRTSRLDSTLPPDDFFKDINHDVPLRSNTHLMDHTSRGALARRKMFDHIFDLEFPPQNPLLDFSPSHSHHLPLTQEKEPRKNPTPRRRDPQLHTAEWYANAEKEVARALARARDLDRRWQKKADQFDAKFQNLVIPRQQPNSEPCPKEDQEALKPNSGESSILPPQTSSPSCRPVVAKTLQDALKTARTPPVEAYREKSTTLKKKDAGEEKEEGEDDGFENIDLDHGDDDEWEVVEREEM